jgi:hypothetical protein
MISEGIQQEYHAEHRQEPKSNVNFCQIYLSTALVCSILQGSQILQTKKSLTYSLIQQYISQPCLSASFKLQKHRQAKTSLLPSRDYSIQWGSLPDIFWAPSDKIKFILALGNLSFFGWYITSKCSRSSNSFNYFILLQYWKETK